MENATKALLIAAAVLVAIIIISLTLGVVRQGQEAIQGADMTEAEIEAHNAKFKQHESTNASVAEVNALLNAVLSHNQLSEAGETVSVSGSGATLLTTATTITRVTGASRYTITCNTTNGLVTSITVTKK